MIYQKKYFPLYLAIFLLFILGLVPFLWFDRNSIIAGGDGSLPLNMKVYFETGVSAWSSSINAGHNLIIELSRFPEYCIFKIISIFVTDVKLIEIIYFSVLFEFGIFSLFFMVWKLNNNTILQKTIECTGASIFYLFNFYTMTRLESLDMPVLYAMIGAPLLIGFFVKNEEKETVFNYLLTGISSIILFYAAVNPPTLLAALFPVGFFYFYEVLIVNKKENKEVKRGLFLIAKTIGIIFMFNLPWIIPALSFTSFNSIYTNYSPVNWIEGISQSCTFKNVIRLMGAWYWYDSPGGMPSAPYAQNYIYDPLFSMATYFVPLLCFIGLLKSISNTKARFFVYITFIGLIFSMGTQGFFGNIYRFMYKYIFFFSIFRSPWFKFSLMTILGFSFLYGKCCGIFYSVSRKASTKIRLFVSFLIFLLVMFPIALSYPIVDGSIFNKLKIRIPNYVHETAGYFEEKAGEGERILNVPFRINDNFKWGYQSVSPILHYLTIKPIIGSLTEIMPNDKTNPFLYEYERLLNEKNSEASNILSILGIKYVLFRYDMLGIDEKTIQSLRDKILQQKNIEFLKKYIDWEVYEVKKSTPLFYVVDNTVELANFDQILNATAKRPDLLFCLKEECPNSKLPGYILNSSDFQKNKSNKADYEFQVSKSNSYKFKVSLVSEGIPPVFYLNNEKLDLEKINEFNYETDKYLPEGKYKFQIDSSALSQKNLLRNGDFGEELKYWEYFEDGPYYSLPIESNVEIYGKNSALIQAINKSIVFRQPIGNLRKATWYNLSFRYQSLDKESLSIKISDKNNTSNYIYSNNNQPFFSKNEQVKNVLLYNRDSTDIFIDFSANVYSTVPNRQVVSNIFFGEAGLIKQIEIFPIVSPALTISTYKRISPTEYEIRFNTDSDALLVFNSTFDKGWRAVEGKKKLATQEGNEYVNAFYIPTQGEHIVKLIFTPQRIFNNLLNILTGVMLVMLIFSGIKFIKK